MRDCIGHVQAQTERVRMKTFADRFKLDGRIALVTGAGSGLGRQFALTLADAGAIVVLAARRRNKLEETAQSIESSGGKAVCVDLDVTDSASVRHCFAEAESSVGVPDVLVNNAGISREAFLVDLSEEDWDAVVNTNLKGVFLVARRAAQAMIEAGKPGSIINIASILGIRVCKMLAAYNAAKSGVLHLTRTMALEWSRYGIRVNAIAPGYFQTDINTGFIETDAAQKLLKALPMRRTGELFELSGPLLLLASDAGSYMTGSTVEVDGGHLCTAL
ncbi:MAG: SDR family NAD(P)-dependent oxidoreductase [Woeseia sp.]